MNPESIVQGMGYAVAAILLMASAFWWGWDCRERLAIKLEFFKVTNRAWVHYDEELKQQRGKLLPLRAQLHEITERQSEK